MAEIVDARQQSLYGAGPIPPQQQPIYGAPQVTSQAPAPAPVAAAASTPAQPTTQDPLFEALIRQITAGLGALPVSSNKLQEQIKDYSAVPGGRAYLEDLVSASDATKMPLVSTRPNTVPAEGYLIATWTKLSLEFTAKRKLEKEQTTIGHVIEFSGIADGVFVPFNKKFTRAEFHYDNVNLNQDCSFKVTYLKYLGIVNVTFYNLLGKDFADLWIYTDAPLPPVDVRGGGAMKDYFW